MSPEAMRAYWQMIDDSRKTLKSQQRKSSGTWTLVFYVTISAVGSLFFIVLSQEYESMLDSFVRGLTVVLAIVGSSIAIGLSFPYWLNKRMNRTVDDVAYGQCRDAANNFLAVRAPQFTSSWEPRLDRSTQAAWRGSQGSSRIVVYNMVQDQLSVWEGPGGRELVGYTEDAEEAWTLYTNGQ